MRAVDLTLTLVALLVMSPVLLLVALAVKCSSPGPVFHRAQRVGKGGRLFTLYKFRSMVPDAAARGPGVTGRDDPRVTPVGRVLRRTKLDEWPQLLNTLKGDMSLVGPRPEDPRYVALYSAEQRQVLSVKPGITSPATVLHRHEEDLLTGDNWEHTYVTQILPTKLRIELDYLSRRTLFSDLRVLADTTFAIIARPSRPDALTGRTPCRS
jgi:lipopolysaccharide/colanic/teichoic acid biosynthesis glycosyltransferase